MRAQFSQDVPFSNDHPQRVQTDQQSHLPYPAPQRVQRTTLSIILLMLMASCASAPQSVNVPVATSCLPASVPEIPRTAESQELASLDDYQLVLRLASERLDLIVYSRQASALIQSCK